MHIPSQIMFLPGALGRTDFWRPAAAQLRHPARQVHVAWPGFAGEPADPSIRHLDDLAAGFVHATEVAALIDGHLAREDWMTASVKPQQR